MTPAAFRTGGEAVALALREIEAFDWFRKGIPSDASTVSLFLEFADRSDLRPVITSNRKGWIRASVSLSLKDIKRKPVSEFAHLFRYVILTALAGIASHYRWSLEDIEASRRSNERLPYGDYASERLGLFWTDAERRMPPPVLFTRSKVAKRQVLVELPVDGAGTKTDLEVRLDLQFLLEQKLRGFELGRCVGGDIGRERIAIYIESDRPSEAAECARRVLEEQGCLGGALISLDQDAQRVQFYPTTNT
jgi:hypothetical protein